MNEQIDNSSPSPCSAFVRVDNTNAGGNERFVRTVSDNVWVSVLHRLTCFGWWEWETAICTKEPRTFNVVTGDRRAELESLPESEVLAWYEAHKAEKNSMGGKPTPRLTCRAERKEMSEERTNGGSLDCCKPSPPTHCSAPDPADLLPPWPCQQLHGGRSPYIYQGCDPDTGLCHHEECNPANDDRVPNNVMDAE